MANTFEKMCKELNEIKPCGCSMCTASNEYVCAYNAVKEYVGKDRNKLLKLKAEAKDGDYITFITTIFAMLSFFIASLSFIITILFEIIEEGSYAKNLFSGAIFLVVAVILIYVYKKIKPFNGVSKWRKYIQTAIEEIEKPDNPDNPENLNKK